MECEFLSCRQQQIPNYHQACMVNRWPLGSHPLNMPGNSHEEGMQSHQQQPEREAYG